MNGIADLFEHAFQQRGNQEAPLAARLRPRNFEEFVGQQHILGPGRALRKVIDGDQLPSMVLWGPPGSGKTTLAYIIAGHTNRHFESLSAVAAGVSDLRRVMEHARERLVLSGNHTILFIDEMHRFSKSQQDVILPYVEDGTITLIGATTENPSFEIIAPLLSRARVYRLHQLSGEEVGMILERALVDEVRGLGTQNVLLEPEAFDLLVGISNGDARISLNSLEVATNATTPDAHGSRTVTLEIVEDALQQRVLMYDKSGDQHYDTISAFIKSVRASDPDAAVYWLVRMLESGEDPMFIARRMIVLAAEDIGLADPGALGVAVAAQQAVHFTGLPEGAIPLTEAVLYLATSPKSNSVYATLNRAREDVRHYGNIAIPKHLRNPITELMKQDGYGKDYKYPHEYPNNLTVTQNLPEELQGRQYYTPSSQGYERCLADRLQRWWGHRENEPGDPPGSKEDV